MNKNTNIYEKVLNSITFPIIIINKEMIILMVNSATEDFFNNSSKIIIGKSINDFIPFASPLVPLFYKCVENNASFKEYKIDLSTPLTGEHKNVDVLDIVLAVSFALGNSVPDTDQFFATDINSDSRKIGFRS